MQKEFLESDEKKCTLIQKYGTPKIPYFSTSKNRRKLRLAFQKKSIREKLDLELLYKMQKEFLK